MQNYVYPSSSDVTLTGSTNGAPIPSTSIVVGGENASGNTEPLQLDSSNNLKVTLAGSGGGEVNVNLNEVGGATFALGQQLAAASLPVVLTAAQLSTLTPLSTVAATQSGTWSTRTQDGSGNAITSTSSALDVNLKSSSITLTISGTVAATQSGTWNINNISGTVSLPTGASTSALQTTGNSTLSTISGQLPASLGAHVTSASLAVNIASDQVVPVSATSLPLPTGAATAANQTNVQSSPGTSAATALTIQGSASGVAVPVSAASLPLPTGAATAANQATEISSLSTIATNTTGLNSTIAATSAAVPAGAIQVGVKNGSNLVPITEGQATMANSLPVTIASNQSAIPVTSSSSGTASANAPVYNAYSSTNITTSAYTQLVASTSNAINTIHIFDSSGQAMILAVGGSGSEVIQLYVPPGGDTYALNIPSGSRIAYKALTATATSGYLLMSFLE